MAQTEDGLTRTMTSANLTERHMPVAMLVAMCRDCGLRTRYSVAVAVLSQLQFCRKGGLKPVDYNRRRRALTALTTGLK